MFALAFSRFSKSHIQEESEQQQQQQVMHEHLVPAPRAVSEFISVKMFFSLPGEEARRASGASTNSSWNSDNSASVRREGSEQRCVDSHDCVCVKWCSVFSFFVSFYILFVIVFYFGVESQHNCRKPFKGLCVYDFVTFKTFISIKTMKRYWRRRCEST